MQAIMSITYSRSSHDEYLNTSSFERLLMPYSTSASCFTPPSPNRAYILRSDYPAASGRPFSKTKRPKATSCHVLHTNRRIDIPSSYSRDGLCVTCRRSMLDLPGSNPTRGQHFLNFLFTRREFRLRS